MNAAISASVTIAPHDSGTDPLMVGGGCKSLLFLGLNVCFCMSAMSTCEAARFQHWHAADAWSLLIATAGSRRPHTVQYEGTCGGHDAPGRPDITSDSPEGVRKKPRGQTGFGQPFDLFPTPNLFTRMPSNPKGKSS